LGGVSQLEEDWEKRHLTPALSSPRVTAKSVKSKYSEVR